VLPQSASAPSLAFGVCSQGSLSLRLPYFLLNPCSLSGDSSCFSYYNKNEHEETDEYEETDTAENTNSQLTVPKSHGSEEGIIKD